MLIENPAPSWRSIWLPLLVLGALALAHDIWYVASGMSDGWLPFLWPAVFIVGAFLLRHFGRKIDPQSAVHCCEPTDPHACVVVSIADDPLTQDRLQRYLDDKPPFFIG